MTVKEAIESLYANQEGIATFEVWKYTDRSRKLHTDYIKNIDSVHSVGEYGDMEVVDTHVMTQEEYDETICANSSVRADFVEWYDDPEAKVLVIMISENADID